MTSPKTPGSGDDADGCAPLVEGPVASSQRPGSPDYGELLPGKICAAPLDTSLDWADWTRWVARVTVPGVEVEGELVHFHFETDESEPPKPGPKLVYHKVLVPPVAPMVATVGSMTFHGSPLAPGIGSIDVYAEGKPVFRMLRDAVACPLATPLPHGGGVVMPMGPPPTVLVNGFAIARAGDAVLEPLGGPNPIAMGALTVFAGPPAPPVVSIHPVGRPADQDKPAWERAAEWLDEQVELDVQAHADVHVAQGSGTASGGIAGSTEDGVVGADGHVRGEGTLLRVDGEIVVELSFFGEKFRLVEEPFDGALGKWKGHGDIIYDPVQRRPGASGEFEFDLFGGDDE